MKRLALTLFVLSLVAGCATPQAMYYWGEYSSSLYAYKKAPNETTLKKHKETLKDVIDGSRKRGLRVPPGVYCEYGYMLAKEGQGGEAAGYFSLEEQTYPGSATLVRALKSRLAKEPAKTD